MANNNLVLQLLITARDQAREVISRTGAAIQGIGQAASDALAPLKTFGGLIAAGLGVAGTKELQERSDAYIRLTNALKVATKTEEDYKAALDAVTGIAQRTHSDLETTASLYARISQNAEKMNINQAQVNELTELISKGMQLGGASASEYASATLQLTQSFGSGVLRGEEFNAVMEASPVLMQKIADGIGVAVGELRGLAEQGKLTAGIVTQALLSQKDAIDTAYAEMTVTVAQAFGDLSNKITIFIGELGQTTGASASAAARLKFLADNINAVAFAIGAGLVGAAAKGVYSLGQYVAASLAARQAAIDQAVATAAQTEATIAAAAANVAATQGAYNRALAEQRAAAAQLAAIESLAGLFAAEEALVAARAQATLAAQNATAATARYAAAQQALAAAQVETAAASTLLSRTMGFLAGPGGLILLAVGAFAGLVAMMSSSKTATEELTGSTDDYAESIKKMNEQQLKGQQLKLDEAINKQREAVEKATAAGWEYADYLDESTGQAVRVYRNTTDLTLAQERLANETDKLRALEEKRTAVLDALASKQELLAGVDAKALIQYVQQGVAMDKLALSVETLSKQQDAVTKANQARIVAEIALAVAAGDLQKVDALTLQLAQEKAKASAQQATLDNAAAVASAAKVTAIEAEYEGYKKISPVQAKTLADAKADADAKAAQAKASAAVAVQLADQAKRTAELNSEMEAAIKFNAELRAAQTGVIQSAINLTKAEIELAEARGDTVAVARLQAILANQEIDQARQLVQQKQQIADDLQKELINKLKIRAATEGHNESLEREIQLLIARTNAASGDVETAKKQVATKEQQKKTTEDVTGATEENTTATTENTATQEESVKTVDNVGKIHKSLIATLTSTRDRMGELSETAKLYFDKMLAGLTVMNNYGEAQGLATRATAAFNTAIEGGNNSGDLAKFSANAIQAADRVSILREQLLMSSNSFSRFENSVLLAEAQTTQAFYEQAAAAEQMRISIEDASAGSVTSLNAIALATNNLDGGFSLLDEQDLANLRSSIEAANDNLREMQAEAQSAQDRIAELNSEIAAERGDTATADRLKLQLEQQQAIAEVTAAIELARNQNNRELIALYEEQKRKLEELYALRERNLEADIKVRDTTATNNRTANTTSGGNNASASNASGGKTINLNFTVAGQNLSATTTQNPDAFVAALKQAQLTAA